MILFFDTETTGKLDFKADLRAPHQPDLVQLAMVLMTPGKKLVAMANLIIEPAGWTISEEVTACHGISQSHATQVGVPRKVALSLFSNLCRKADTLVAHNIDFDTRVMTTQMYRESVTVNRMAPLKQICTMRAATPVVRIMKPWITSPNGPDPFKWPSLTETYQHLFKTGFDGAHNAMADVKALIRVYWALDKLGALAVKG